MQVRKHLHRLGVFGFLRGESQAAVAGHTDSGFLNPNGVRQRRFALAGFVSRIDRIAENQHGHNGRDAGILAELFLVVLEEADTVLNLERNLVGL
jgi:hypothetical protein